MTDAQNEVLDPEVALIATLLRTEDPTELDLAASALQASNFRDARCAACFEAFLSLHQRNVLPDNVMLASELKTMGKLEVAGGPQFLLRLPFDTVMPNLGEYAKLVRERSLRRGVQQLGMDLHNMAREEVIPTVELLETLDARAMSLMVHRQSEGPKAMSDVVSSYLTWLDRARAEDANGTGLTTGLPDVDRILHMQPGELIVLAARPGVGKTSFAMQIGLNAVSHGHSALFFSLEMPNEQLMMRLTASKSGIPIERIRRARLSPHEHERIGEAAESLFHLPLYFDDASTLSPLDIKARARRVKRADPRLGLIIIDYLQLVTPKGRFESRQAEVAHVSKSLKALAKELGVVVLALSQLNRRVEERKGPPQLSDLRESGAIEQDSDAVLFIHREKADDDEDSKPASTELIQVELHIAKQRNGGLGSASLMFRGNTTHFESALRH